jgi:8-oxo-dGTP pyrophosphatase MutT (NUDIX family)
MKPGIDYPGVGVSFFCYGNDGRFVMSKRGKNCSDEVGLWDLGGGKIEHGQTIEQALLSEISQEYRVIPEEFKYLGTRESFRSINGEVVHFIHHDFMALVNLNNVDNGEPEKFDEVKIFEEIPPVYDLHSLNPEFMRLYREDLQQVSPTFRK